MHSGAGRPCTDTPWSRLEGEHRARLARLPRSLAILLENILVSEPDPAPYVEMFEAWLVEGTSQEEIPFRPSRILLQDTAGVAVLADLAALRDHHVTCGGNAEGVDAAIPIDLVIDHSVRVDHSGTSDALARNMALEYERNQERYSFFKWAQHSFPRLHVVPPGQGICHQINLERLAEIATPLQDQPDRMAAQTMIGTDSHTTMVNALGILGWGVGGIEAEVAALGGALPIPLPEVCAVRLTGRPGPGVTATDLALHITALLRTAGVVDQIVEFDGDALDALSLPDRAAIANMCPEYGATAALFPVDKETLAYLAAMGRSAPSIEGYRAYAKATGLWRDSGPPRRYSRSIDIDLNRLQPVLAGPHRPQQLHPLTDVPQSLRAAFPDIREPGDRGQCGDGAIAIAAITSCTSTANPDLMVAAGLVARNAVARGLTVPPWVKTSLAPGSRHIAALLEVSGLQRSLDALGFHLVGFGCTTCVGNSGDLKPDATPKNGEAPLLTAILSGNRNFENRIHPGIRANYLGSPPLVVAAALAGNLLFDLSCDPLGLDTEGRPVMLSDLWPDPAEVSAIVQQAMQDTAAPDIRADAWDALPAAETPCFAWDAASTFICPPPFFREDRPVRAGDLIGARALLWLGDNITTDHISPIGRIQPDSPAGRYLQALGVPPGQLGSYGDRRANHHVMLRGTFDNARLDNKLADQPGNRAIGPCGRQLSIFEAAAAFAREQIPTVIVAGENYGVGSARDWAAKGTALLGVRAVIAHNFERIHRNNLIAMGVLPVVLTTGQRLPPLTPQMQISILGLDGLSPANRDLIVQVCAPDGEILAVLTARADARSLSQIELFATGGIFARLKAQYG